MYFTLSQIEEPRDTKRNREREREIKSRDTLSDMSPIVFREGERPERPGERKRSRERKRTAF